MASAQSKVELIVDASKAVNPLRKTEQATRKLEGAVRDANGRLRDAKGRFVGMGNSAKRAKGSIDSLSGAFTKLAAAISVIGVGKFVFFKTAELQTQTRSLKVLTGSLETAKGIIAELQAFGNVTPFTSAELIETAKRLKAFGFETEKIVDVTKRLSDIAGATGADLGGIATAFGQIQAKGRLQGEELLQLQERGVDLQGTLREAYGLTAEEFQKALSAGRIGADAVNYALEKLTETGGKYAEGAFAQSDTLSGKLSTLQDNVDNLARVFGETMAPALASIIDDITKMVNTFVKGLQFMQTAYNDFMKSLRSTTITDVQKDIEGLNERIANQQRQLSLVSETAPGGVGVAQGFRDTISQLRAMRTDLEAELGRLTGTGLFMPKAVTFKAPTVDGAAPPSLGAGTQPKGKGRAKPKKSPLEIQQEQAAKLLQAEKDRQFVLQQSNEKQRLGAQLISDIAAIKRENGLLDQKELQSLIQAKVGTYQLQIQEIDRAAASKAEDERKRKALQEQQREAQRLEEIYGQLGQTIATGVGDMLMAAVDQTKSLAEVASNMLRNLANQLMQVAVNTALFSLFPGSSLFKSLPRFADGGSIKAGQTSIVGERGPELFTPGRSGSIAPNSSLSGGANVVVNVDASGSNAQGNNQNARQLGNVIGAAVQAELIKQQRPGGLLAR